MEDNFESKVNAVKQQIEEDFKNLNEKELETFFEQFKNDRRTVSFLEYYNRTVLDKERINFGEFKRQWAIQGMTKEVFNYFNNNFDKLKIEIQTEKNIQKFFKEHCCTVRNEASFCSKVFHTILPKEFPPVDNPIKNKRFHLKDDLIQSVLIIKQGYELFIKKNQDKMQLIRRVLSKPKFAYLRVNELSDIRILDMYYWFKENREKSEATSFHKDQLAKLEDIERLLEEKLQKVRMRKAELLK